MIHIINKHHDPKRKGEYVGRPRALGNPFVIGKDGNRLEVISNYRRWLWQEMQREVCRWGPPLRGHSTGELCYQGPVYRKLLDLKQQAIDGDLTLICFCHPKPCHAEVIKNCIEWMILKDK